MNVSKLCTRCKEVKEYTEFYFRTDTGKYKNQCRKCVNIISRDRKKIYYEKNKNKILKRIRARHKKFNSSEEGIEYNKKKNAEYHSKNKDNILERKRKYSKTHEAKLLIKTNKTKHKDKAKVHAIIGGLTRRKKITKKPCIVCGSKKLIAAHHENYLKPLEIIYLCYKHHMRLHASERKYEKLCLENYNFVFDIRTIPILINKSDK